MIGRRALSIAAAALLLGTFSGSAHSQSYPQRSIKLVVPFPAGGANDTVARLVAQGITSRLGQSVVIENQGGAGGTLGGRQVANATPDGHTLLMVGPGTYGTGPLLYKLDYDPMKAFVPVAALAIDKLVMVAAPSLPARTLQEVVQYAKSNSGKLNYGSAIGIPPHFIMELFKIKAGIDVAHVPYRGGAPMITDLLGGQIQLTVNNKSVLLPHILEGRLKPLAVASKERWRQIPNVPTLIEAGYFTSSFDVVFGIVAPAGTPSAAINAINAAINETLTSPEVRASFAKVGIEPRAITPQEFGSFMADDALRWAEVVRTTGIRAE
jgi:tripartite-type tricarboxylate transporter receptor subunit TctC